MTTYALSKYTNNFPTLSEEEELKLAKDYRATGNIEAAHKLALAHLPLVFKIANRYKGYGLCIDDLAQEGFIGLLNSIKKFDPFKGVRLAAFAIYDIKNKIGEYIVKNIRQVKIATTKAALRLFWNREVVNNDIEVLETLNVTKLQLEDFEARYAGKESSVDNEESLNQLPSTYKTPLESLEDRDEQRQVEALKAAVASLDERTRHIITGRYLQDPPKTFKELGVELGISTQRVEQIAKQAVKELKSSLVSV